MPADEWHWPLHFASWKNTNLYSVKAVLVRYSLCQLIICLLLAWLLSVHRELTKRSVYASVQPVTCLVLMSSLFLLSSLSLLLKKTFLCAGSNSACLSVALLCLVFAVLIMTSQFEVIIVSFPLILQARFLLVLISSFVFWVLLCLWSLIIHCHLCHLPFIANKSVFCWFYPPYPDVNLHFLSCLLYSGLPPMVLHTSTTLIFLKNRFFRLICPESTVFPQCTFYRVLPVFRVFAIYFSGFPAPGHLGWDSSIFLSVS